MQTVQVLQFGHLVLRIDERILVHQMKFTRLCFFDYPYTLLNIYEMKRW